MVDVLLVLLIFFMSITTAQVLKVDKSITLPISTNASKKDNQRAEAIVNVKWDIREQEGHLHHGRQELHRSCRTFEGARRREKAGRDQRSARGQIPLSAV